MKPRTVYEWSVRGLFKGVHPQVAGERIEQLRVKGRLTPSAIVEDARSPKSPLHRCFQWDDSKAAEKWRLQQARLIVSHLVIKVKIGRRVKPATTRAFVSIQRPEPLPKKGAQSTAKAPREQNREYVTVRAALKDETMRTQVLRAALREIESWRTKYRDLKELTRVFAAMDEVERKLERLAS